ncbi:SPOSA6832_02489, partial [Sporobolomyces salmonicolor]
MSPPPAGGKDSHAARILGSGTSGQSIALVPLSISQRSGHSLRLAASESAGIAELAIFHPVDTVAKRLMSNKVSGKPMMEVVFREHATATAGKKFLSLFPGLGYAAGYKSQPYFNDFLNKNFKQSFSSVFGEKNGKAMMAATAGSLTGIGEIVLLPLDVLKIKRQTNPEAFRSRGFLQIVKDEGFGLYRGASWTAARNAPGSFALFGGSAFTKEYVFGLQDYRTATWYQNFVASIAGSVSSIAISQPLDVIKTRIQNQNFESKVGGMQVVRDLIKHEGFTAFFKGLTPKVLVVGPKLIFSFTLAQTLIPIFSKYV